MIISPSLLSSMLLQHTSESLCFCALFIVLYMSHYLSSYFAQNFFSYSLDPAHLPLSAESYDAVVYRFLTNIMTRKNDSRDTYIILRSDHGLQGERDDVAENVVFSFNGSHLLSYLL